MKNKSYWIERLKMEKHQEGGYYTSYYESPIHVTGQAINKTFEGTRPLATSIYFLIEENDASNFHRLQADEIWYFHEGSPLTVAVISPEGVLTEHKLGLDFDKGERPQLLVPAGSIFGSYVNEAYALVSCAVAFGFDFRDFELFEREDLLKQYPEHSKIVKKLTR